MARWTEINENLTTPEFFATGRHHEVFWQLRAEDPVHWTDGSHAPRPFWSVTRHADCVRIMEDSGTFPPEHGGIMPSTAEYPTPEQRHVLGYGARPDTMLPPYHLRVRQPFNKHFSAPAMARMRDKIQKCIDEIMADVAPRGKCELVEDVCAQLPMRLVLEMMGVPDEDADEVRRTVAMMGAPQDPHFQIDANVQKTFMMSLDKINKYMLNLALQRREAPLDDFTSVAGTLLADGHLLDDRTLGFWCMGFVVGGLETTRDALSIGFYELMQRPDQAQLLRDDPSLASTAADEIIRWSSPSKYKWRVAARDVEIGGKLIKEGDWVVCWLVSANRDEAVFSHADQFDVTRKPNPHLAFSAGDHACIGRHLARLEITMMVNAVMRHMPDMQVAGPHELIISSNHSGYRMLPVRFTPNSGRALETT